MRRTRLQRRTRTLCAAHSTGPAADPSRTVAAARRPVGADPCSGGAAGDLRCLPDAGPRDRARDQRDEDPDDEQGQPRDDEDRARPSTGTPVAGPAVLVSGRAIAMPGTSPTATPSTHPTAASRKAAAAAISRRVPRVAPRAARVAWSVCCSARVSAVDVRVMTRMSRAKTPRRTATMMASSRAKPALDGDARPRRRAPPAAARPPSCRHGCPRGVAQGGCCGRRGHPGVTGVSAASTRPAPSIRASVSAVPGRVMTGTVDLLLDLHAGVDRPRSPCGSMT